MKDNLGRYAFIGGLVLAVIAGIMLTNFQWDEWILVALGIVVGFLNISGEETGSFLLAGVTLLVSFSAMREFPNARGPLWDVLLSGSFFIVPALIVVAVKTLFKTAKD